MANLRRSGDFVEIPLANEVTGVVTGTVYWINTKNITNMFRHQLTVDETTRFEGGSGTSDFGHDTQATPEEILGFSA